jgi:hypothetical protein
MRDGIRRQASKIDTSRTVEDTICPIMQQTRPYNHEFTDVKTK